MSGEEREIVLVRQYNAPRELVFQAWTKQEHVAEWWGPEGFTITTNHMEVKPNGVWSYQMHGPEGVNYPNRIVYKEVKPHERLVYSHGASEADPEHFQVIVTFEEQGAGTELKMRMIFPTAEVRKQSVEQYGALEGGKQTLERLARHLSLASE